MRSWVWGAAVLGVWTGAWAQHAHGPETEPTEKRVPLFEDLGDFTRPVTTGSREAQAYFDQGFRLYFAFNHDEAYRAFAKAAELDPDCAMCWWGAALSLGPNYNMPMMPDRGEQAWRAREKAVALARAGQVTPEERALIGALAVRYDGPKVAEDPKHVERLNRAYADRMRQAAEQFPDDADVQVLFAESLMDLNPWKLWTKDGRPAPGTEELVGVLEAVLERWPEHPGANHLYIHAVEASKNPERALAAAKRVGSMMPGAGHLVHMPAHIYQRTGRYEAASQANREAIEADRRYAKAAGASANYLGMYGSHNFTFLAYSAAMQGRSEEAITAAEEGAKNVLPEAVKAMPVIEFYAAQPAVMRVRFSRWDELLEAPPPNEAFPVATGLWLHARGLALAEKGRLAEAERLRERLTKLREELPEDYGAGMSSGRDLLSIAGLVLDAKLAEKSGRQSERIEMLRKAVLIEDSLGYDEPPNWWYPVRHLLGEALLDADRPADAEQVFRADLEVHPNNGWSLHGLAEAVERQGRAEEAKRLRAQYEEAFARADIRLARGPVRASPARQVPSK